MEREELWQRLSRAMYHDFDSEKEKAREVIADAFGELEAERDRAVSFWEANKADSAHWHGRADEAEAEVERLRIELGAANAATIGYKEWLESEIPRRKAAEADAMICRALRQGQEDRAALERIVEPIRSVWTNRDIGCLHSVIVRLRAEGFMQVAEAMEAICDYQERDRRLGGLPMTEASSVRWDADAVALGKAYEYIEELEQQVAFLTHAKDAARQERDGWKRRADSSYCLKCNRRDCECDSILGQEKPIHHEFGREGQPNNSCIHTPNEART